MIPDCERFPILNSVKKNITLRNICGFIILILLCGIVVSYHHNLTNGIKGINKNFQGVNEFICKCYQKNVNIQPNVEELGVKVFTVETSENDGILRMIRSANYYNIKVEILGIGRHFVGYGTKINWFREALEPFKKDDKTIIIFTDGHDVLYTNTLDVIVDRFKKLDARVLFGAERGLWPDHNVGHLYPNVSRNLPKYLNAGLHMGYASDLYELMHTSINDNGDDQRYYTKAFLNVTIRQKFRIKLDYESQVFQDLFDASKDVKLIYNETTGKYILKNIQTGTDPCILHANGPSKPFLNDVSRYLITTFKSDVRKQFRSNLSKKN